MKTVFINASPKRTFSASDYFLDVQRFFVKGQKVKEKLRNQNDYERILNTLQDADAVVFSLPLYVDGIPSHVIPFLKEMEGFCKENKLQFPVYVISNGGFIEGKQNEASLQIFENFCARSGLSWGGGIGIGGGVMLNVLKIMFYVQIGILLLNMVLSGTQNGNWLPVEAFTNFLTQVIVIVFFNLGVFLYTLQMGHAINKSCSFTKKYTRILIPSFVFIVFADIFFVIVSLFKGGLFRGWLKPFHHKEN